MKNSLLSAILSLVTLTLVQGADTPTQPSAGAAAPDFSLPTNDGSQVSLKDFKGKWVVLYFYPKDMTSGCTIEAKNFQRDLDQYTKTGTVILGVSVDTPDSHKEFCAKEGLTFKLLADPGGRVSAQYGSTMDYNGATMAARNTFLINPAGKIAKAYPRVKPAEHSEHALKDLAGLQKRSG